MDILILGGTGAMGIALVDILCENAIYVTSRSKREDNGNIHYLQGNAHDIGFISDVLKSRKWDSVIDFMTYTTGEFEERYELFLENTSQYIFTSSARVYAESDEPIKETTPRLLDVCKDEEYLKTDEYALTKARQENILINSGRTNWTIVRPSVTYNSNRLQLGVLEKEHWLYRALKGRTIVFSNDIGEKLTSFTSGFDVSCAIAALVGNPKANGRCFHITDANSYKWNEILEMYLDIIEKTTGTRPKVKMTDKTTCFDIGWNKYQIIYCRYYNRTFNNDAISEFFDNSKFADIHKGIETALLKFIDKPSFKDMSWRLEGVNDKLCKERTPLSEMPGIKDKVQYILYRYFPSKFANRMFKILKRG